MPETARRRSFLRALATAPLLPAALAGEARAQTAPAPPQPSVPPSPSPDVPGPVAEALGEAARARFGAHLKPGDLVEIKKAIQGNLDAADRLRVLKLGNADEPVTLFEPRPHKRRAKDVSTGRGTRPIRRLNERED